MSRVEFKGTRAVQRLDDAKLGDTAASAAVTLRVGAVVAFLDPVDADVEAAHRSGRSEA
jgi:hypothetical protein